MREAEGRSPIPLRDPGGDNLQSAERPLRRRVGEGGRRVCSLCRGFKKKDRPRSCPGNKKAGGGAVAFHHLAVAFATFRANAGWRLGWAVAVEAGSGGVGVGQALYACSCV